MMRKRSSKSRVMLKGAGEKSSACLPNKGGHNNPDVIAHGYYGTVDGDSEDGILRPASVYSPKKRIVATASKETGTHIPFSGANCNVR